ncbi:MAG: N-acetyltransferase [Pseudomonadota bacterium]
MSAGTFQIALETVDDHAAVDALTWRVFGPGMVARAAYALREGVPHEPSLAFLAKEPDGAVIGTVRFTRVRWGGEPAWMLGPLAVAKKRNGLGIGSALMRTAMAACGQQAEEAGIQTVLLVGDLAYYEPFGFQRIPPGNAILPRPAAPNRILVCPLNQAPKNHPSGRVERWIKSQNAL